jgi:hypothetical protein
LHQKHHAAAAANKCGRPQRPAFCATNASQQQPLSDLQEPCSTSSCMPCALGQTQCTRCVMHRATCTRLQPGKRTEPLTQPTNGPITARVTGQPCAFMALQCRPRGLLTQVSNELPAPQCV